MPLRVICIALLPTFSSANGSLAITVEQLSQQLKSSSLPIILDVRPIKDYQKNHLPNARAFPASWTYANEQLSGRLTPPSTFQEKVQKTGLNTQQNIVIYDNGNLFDAARVFWALEVYGFSNIALLNQGYQGWQKQHKPLTTETPNFSPSNYVVTINQERLASKFTTQLATLNPNTIIIDARLPQFYFGKVSMAKRKGHIPTAINLPAKLNIIEHNGNKQIKSMQALKKVYQGIPQNAKIITYCSYGKTSAINYLVLRMLGFDVANYDASWKEWGNDFNLPVELNPNPVPNATQTHSSQTIRP